MYDLEYVMESHGHHASPKEVKKKRDAKVEVARTKSLQWKERASDGSMQTASVSVA